MSPPINVLLVDDSAFVRRALQRILRPATDMQVVGEAGDGAQALELVATTAVDVVLLDLGLPGVSGREVLQTLTRSRPDVAVVVVSAATRRGAEATADALGLGAFDVIDKSAVSAMEVYALGDEVVGKVRAAARRSAPPAPAPATGAAQQLPAPIGVPELVVLGASTGGPPALMALARALTPDFPAPVVAVQHMPAAFLEAFAHRLHEEASLPVELARPGVALRPGVLYVPGSGREWRPVRVDGRLALVAQPARRGAPHMPSVDGLFHGAAATCGERTWGVLLTGMGEDGAEGLAAIRAAGGFTIAQDEASCAVFGMPRAAIARGAAAVVLSLSSIASFFAHASGGERARFTLGPMGGP